MPRLVDLTGQRFGRLAVLYRGANVDRCVVWLCQCDCSPEAKIHVRGAALRSGQTKSCGCFRAEKARSRGFDLTGRVFGWWRVIKQAPNRGLVRYWLCECLCSKHTQMEIGATSLLAGKSRSCHHARGVALPAESLPLAA
jgi:hypothetical protein